MMDCASFKGADQGIYGLEDEMALGSLKSSCRRLTNRVSEKGPGPKLQGKICDRVLRFGELRSKIIPAADTSTSSNLGQ